jgi:hypothetical protein
MYRASRNNIGEDIILSGRMMLCTTTTTTLFTGSYGWSLELTGLAYLGIGIGFCAGNFTVVHPYQKKLMGMNGAKKRQGASRISG